MTAPAAPVITKRVGGVGTARLRWPSVSTAATYKVYVNALPNGQTFTDAASGKNEAVVSVGPSDSLTVTALNVGLEESAASNAVVVQGPADSQTSYPPGRPRGPYTGPFG